MQRGDKTPFSSRCRNYILKRKFQKKSVVKAVILCYNYYIDVTIFREEISFKQKNSQSFKQSCNNLNGEKC